MHAGELITVSLESLPDAATDAIPAARAVSIACFVAAFWLSQLACDEYSPPPRLRLIAAIACVPARAAAKLMPWTMSDVYASAHGSSPAPLQLDPENSEKTRIAISSASGATPP